MRSAGANCAGQQTLTTEAASVLKHSLHLARRRGHSQVTPLHVASTLLITSRPNSLFTRALLNSQQHPHPNSPQAPLLHYNNRALDLCFNVSLNRLPTTHGPLLHGQPSLSNALIAALKRAQAHQRRGCSAVTDNQNPNQPILAIRVELEQLILSILDDPSVSRVMREAGFSSSVIKTNLEDISSSSSSSASPVFRGYNGNSSGGVYSSPCSPSRESVANSTNPWDTHFLNFHSERNPVFISPQLIKTPPNRALAAEDHHHSVSCVKEEDIRLVFEVMLGKKRKNTVIVSDSLATREGLITALMTRVERKRVPDELKSAHFIDFSQFSYAPIKLMKREEVEMKLSELRRKVDSLLSSSGGGKVIVYTGDMKWTVDDEEREGGGGGPTSDYSPVDHLVKEIGELVSCEFNGERSRSTSTTRVWLMGSANYQTYMKCKLRQPMSLEVQWGLQAVSVPSGGLGLSLHATR